MKIEISAFLDSLSAALDYVESEFIEIEPYHPKRVAVMSYVMGKSLGMDPAECYAMACAALLHDCALPEYLADEKLGEGLEVTEAVMEGHCLEGERRISKFPFYSYTEGTVLYHHERADGKGAFGKLPNEIPMRAQLVHIADAADVLFSFYTFDEDKYARVLAWLDEESGKTFSAECADAFRKSVNHSLLRNLAGDGCKVELRRVLIPYEVEIPSSLLREISTLFAEIIDFKSAFTRRHSLGIAEKAQKMGEFYGLDEEMCDRLYVAGALHDVGKLIVDNSILEKPGKLTPDEYKTIQDHALGTWYLLRNIGGMEEIARWAALHHEKLDGSGYPFGYDAERLTMFERLMGCIDIYQALVEERPYKAGLSHEAAIGILRKMGSDGQLDNALIDDVDHCFSGASAVEGHGIATTPAVPEDMHGWRCPVCGYVYEGDPLPEGFVCPRCEQPGTIFERV